MISVVPASCLCLAVACWKLKDTIKVIGVTQVCLMVLLVALAPFSSSFSYFIVPCWESWLLYPGKAQQWQEQCYSFLPLRAVLPWVQTVVWLPVFVVSVMPLIADGGLDGHHKRVCAGSWLARLGEKSLATQCQYCNWLFCFSQVIYQQSYSCPSNPQFTLFSTTFIDRDHYFKFTAVPDMFCSYLITFQLCMIVIVNDIICIMI